MNTAELSRYASWSALASAIFTIVGLITLIIFFSAGQPWGTLNDISSVILALSLLPVLFVLHRLYAQPAPAISLAALVIGVLAMLVAITFQTLLIAKVISFAQTAVIVPAAFGLFGLSLIAYCLLANSSGAWPGLWVVLGIVAGTGYALTITGFLLGGEQHPLTAVGGLTAVICYPIWAIWFSRLLSSGRL